MNHILNQLVSLPKYSEIVYNYLILNFINCLYYFYVIFYIILFKIFTLAPLPQRCFSIYASSNMKEKIFNVKCKGEEDASDFIDNLKVVMDFMSKNKTIKNTVLFTLSYKN